MDSIALARSSPQIAPQEFHQEANMANAAPDFGASRANTANAREQSEKGAMPMISVFLEVFARDIGSRLDVIERQIVERCFHVEQAIVQADKKWDTTRKGQSSIAEQLKDMEQSMQLQMDKFRYTVEGTYWQVERLVESAVQPRQGDVIDIDQEVASMKNSGKGEQEPDFLKGLHHMEQHLLKVHSKLDELSSQNTQRHAKAVEIDDELSSSKPAMVEVITSGLSPLITPSHASISSAPGSSLVLPHALDAQAHTLAAQEAKKHTELVHALHAAMGFTKVRKGHHSHAPKRPGRESWQSLGDFAGFHFASVFTILFNQFLTGVESDIEVRYLLNSALFQEGSISEAPDVPDSQFFRIMDALVVLWWCFEAAVYALAQGESFLKVHNPMFRWNVLDICCVLVSIFELVTDTLDGVVSLPGIGFVKLLRVCRVVRVLRLLHTVKAFQGVRKLIIAVRGAMLTLAWALVLQIVLMYMFTICINQGIRHYHHRLEVVPPHQNQTSCAQMDRRDSRTHTQLVNQYYGGVTVTMATLFMSITGGDWTVFAEPVFRLAWVFYLIWYSYTGFVIFGLLNVFTGIFVESASHAANSDREVMIQAQMEEEESYLNQIRVIFERTDVDHSGNMTEKELEILLEQDEFKLQMAALGIAPTEAHGLFKLLDGDRSGIVSIEEFLSGCIRLKGTAKAVDMITLIFENAKLGRKMEKIRRMLADLVDDPAQPADNSSADDGEYGEYVDTPMGGAPGAGLASHREKDV